MRYAAENPERVPECSERSSEKAGIRPSLRCPSVQNCQLRSQQQPHGTVGSSTELVIRTWPPALLVLCAGIHRFSGSREGRPRRSRRDNIGCCRSWGGARGRWGPASWSVAAAFDRQGKAIGCEPPARDERVCPPGGALSRMEEYRSFLPSGRLLRFFALHSALSAP